MKTSELEQRLKLVLKKVHKNTTKGVAQKWMKE